MLSLKIGEKKRFLVVLPLLLLSTPTAPSTPSPGGAFPHPFRSVGKIDVPALQAKTARVMEMPDGMVAGLISELAPIRLVGCPNCQGGSQDSSVDVWSLDDPAHVKCGYCGERYPSERYPLDGALEVVNPRNERQAYRYHDGGNEKRRYFFEGVISASADQ